MPLISAARWQYERSATEALRIVYLDSYSKSKAADTKAKAARSDWQVETAGRSSCRASDKVRIVHGSSLPRRAKPFGSHALPGPSC